ncbi:hypothetical protein H6776_01370 [Candidatus Nomurabacteria bacterium]|nr:hypothetical protein [Candidatus Nomurabacteria bacterium]
MTVITSQERNHRAVMALFALVLFFVLFLIIVKGKAESVIAGPIATHVEEHQEMIDEALEL